MKLTKEEFEELYSDTVTKKNYDKIINKIDIRFSEICNFIIKKAGWFDYANNCGESSESQGYFDPKEYRIEIPVTGENAKLPEPYYYGSMEKGGYLSNSFPTRWLWEDFEDEFNNEVKQFVERQLKEEQNKKSKTEAKKLKKLEMKNIIKSKLTAEELKYINFK